MWKYLELCSFACRCAFNLLAQHILTEFTNVYSITFQVRRAAIPFQRQGCKFVPYTFSETKPQMVPMDLNIGETRVWLWFGAKSTTRKDDTSAIYTNLFYNVIVICYPLYITLIWRWWAHQDSSLTQISGLATTRCPEKRASLVCQQTLRPGGLCPKFPFIEVDLYNP